MWQGGKWTFVLILPHVERRSQHRPGPLAGVLIATLGTASCYVVQTGCYLLAVVWTLGLRPTPNAASSGCAAPKATFGQSIVEGWTFSWRNEAGRAGFVIALGASLCIMP